MNNSLAAPGNGGAYNSTYANSFGGGGGINGNGGNALATNSYAGGGGINGNGSITLGSAALTVNSGSFSGNITGTGSLTKISAGNLTLTGTGSTYSGGTTISTGTLTGNTTSLQGNITDNAALVFNQNTADGTFGAMITNSLLALNGRGLLVVPVVALNIIGTGSLTKTVFVRCSHINILLIRQINTLYKNGLLFPL